MSNFSQLNSCSGKVEVGDLSRTPEVAELLASEKTNLQ